MKAYIHPHEEATPRSRIVERSHLFCTRGTSDKEYDLVLEQVGVTWIVRANYGRRGSVLRPVEKYRGRDEGRARTDYAEIRAEKIGKGYREGARSTAVQGLSYPFTQIDAPKQKTAKPKTAKPPQKIERNITLGDL